MSLSIIDASGMRLDPLIDRVADSAVISSDSLRILGCILRIDGKLWSSDTIVGLNKRGARRTRRLPSLGAQLPMTLAPVLMVGFF